MQYDTIKRFNAWLLIFSIVLLYVVKATHHHDQCELHTYASSHSSSQPEHDKCLICDFSLAPVIENQTTFINSVVMVSFHWISEPILSIQKSTVLFSSLRAPPAFISSNKFNLARIPRYFLFI